MQTTLRSPVTSSALVLLGLLGAGATGCATEGTQTSGSEIPTAPSSAGVGATPAPAVAGSRAAASGSGGTTPIATTAGTAGTRTAGVGGVAAVGGAPSSSGAGGAAGSSLPVAGAAGSLPVAGAAGGALAAAGTGGFAGASSAAGSDASTSGSGGSSSAGAGGSVSPPSGPGPVGQHGALHVKGNRVVDAAGQPFQLRGMSLFWSQWTNFYAARTVDQLADDWHATLVRAALGIETDGFLESPAANEAKIVAVVDRAIERGLYVIIDWHDHHAQDHQAAAIEFFTRMATKYRSAPGVIFEIYNEPMDVGWPAVKAYAQAVIAAIRGAGANNLVIVGTPNWSQDVDVAAQTPVTGFSDVAYTLHFYAATHKQPLRDKAKAALDAGLALFVTEWGTCEANGNGTVDQAETKTWLDFLANNGISWANWALNDKAEACSALTPSAGTTGPWSGSALTASGALVKPLIK